MPRRCPVHCLYDSTIMTSVHPACQCARTSSIAIASIICTRLFMQLRQPRCARAPRFSSTGLVLDCSRTSQRLASVNMARVQWSTSSGCAAPSCQLTDSAWPLNVCIQRAIHMHDTCRNASRLHLDFDEAAFTKTPLQFITLRASIALTGSQLYRDWTENGQQMHG